MNFTKLMLATAVATVAELGVDYGWQKIFPPADDLKLLISNLAAPENPLGWNILTAFSIAVLAALLFHSLAIPGSRIQRGIYVGFTVGLMSSVISSAMWLSKFDLPMGVFQREFPKTMALGLVAGVIYSLFYLKQKTEP